MPIRFLRDYTVQDREGARYSKDEVRDDLSPASEQHFVNRNAAEYIEAGGSKPNKTDEQPANENDPNKPARKRTKRAAS